MSYTITLWCGCRVYVSCHPVTRAAHTRIIERRGAGCQDRHHDIGFRLRLWELLPDQRLQQAAWNTKRADAGPEPTARGSGERAGSPR
jgi:hypothetical protein